jgi:hypothetical protein
MSRVEIEPVDRVEITILMDNVTDPLLVDQDAVARINWPKALMGALPIAPVRVSPDGGVPDALVASLASQRSCASKRLGASEPCRRDAQPLKALARSPATASTPNRQPLAA